MANTSKTKQTLNTGVPDRVEEFVAGDRNRTAWSARVMNQIIRVLNRNSNIRGVNGIKVFKSDSNIVISYSNPNEPLPIDENPAVPFTSGSSGGTGGSCVVRYS